MVEHAQEKQGLNAPFISTQLQLEREKGRQEGKALERLELARKMRLHGHPFEVVTELTGLSRKQIVDFHAQSL